MTKTFIVPMAAGLMLSALAASAGESAMRADSQALQPVSGVYAHIQAREDYGTFGKVSYGRGDRVYRFTYTARDGTEKQVTIDAITGKQVL
jgi:uncharacterized membrane protein YkoI